MAKEKITIYIPTKNRSDFLFRLLHYFANTKYQHWIFIGDSSNDFHLNETKKTIQSLKDKLNIEHFECPGLSDSEAIAHMNQFVKTPYCAFLADDDFLCTKSLDKCVDFLESNPGYGAAHGLGIGTRIDGSGPYGDVNYVHYYPQATLNADSGSQRLLDCFKDGYALIFSVHRSRDWQTMHQAFRSPAPWARQNFTFNELIPSSISSVRNKIKELNCLYLLRFGHGRVYERVKTYDWICSPDWFPGFKNLHDRVIDELMRQDGISKKEAEEVFKQAFCSSLHRSLLPPRQSYPRRTLTPLVEKIDRQMPGFKEACRKIISYFQTKKESNLLPSLLKPTSPYHQDFMPIYRAITTPNGY